MKKYLIIVLISFTCSCETFWERVNGSQKDTSLIKPPVITEPIPPPLQPKEEPPVINVEPTIIRPQLFLVMKEYANFESDAHNKLNVIFNNLDFILKKNNLPAQGAAAAWKVRQPNIIIVEGGIPLAKKFTYPEPGTYYKQTKRCAAAVAHFFGKRSLLPQAYEALQVWVKENHKHAIGHPWEVYVSDPKVMKDKAFLQTDVFVEVR